MMMDRVPPLGSSTPSCIERESGSKPWRSRCTRRALRPRSVDCSPLMASSSSSTSTGMARLFSSNLKIEENNLAIPVEVLEELDSIKGEQSTERGRNARRVHRLLQELLPDSRSMHEGVELPNGGTLSIIINPYLMEAGRHSPAMERLRAILPDLTKKDNRIIAAALFVQEQFPPPTILVTKDVNVQLKARALGLESEDYLNDKVPEDVEEASYREISLTIYELQRFCSEGQFELEDEAAQGLYLNQYVLLRSDEGKTMPARFHGDGL